jgi:hypothetical protein
MDRTINIPSASTHRWQHLVHVATSEEAANQFLDGLSDLPTRVLRITPILDRERRLVFVVEYLQKVPR